tara:strand:+ start:403 stop:1833 length:1431 start_codon:yes stop_codon:yes gene_type:complete
MDEEQQQPNKKIDLDSFFNRVDQVEGVANKALKTANSNLGVINANKTLISSLSVSIEAMKTQIRDIANYIIVERKLEKDKEEDRKFEEEDAKQKKDMDERLKNLQPADGKDGSPGPVGETKDGKSSGGGLGGFLGGILKVVGGLTLAAGFAALAPIIAPALLVGGGAILITFLTDKLLKFIMPKIGKFFGDMSKKFGESFNKLKENIGKKFNAMAESISKKFNALKDNVMNIAKAGFEKTKEGLAGAADFLTGGIFDFDKKGSSESDDNIVGNLFKSTKNVVDSVTKDIKESGLAQTAKNIAKSGMKTVSNVATSAKDKVMETASNVKDAAVEGFTEAKEKAKEVTKDGTNAIKEKFEDVKEKSLNILDPERRIVTKAQETVVEKVTDVKERGILGVLGGIADKVTGDRFDFDQQGGQMGGTSRTPRQKISPSQVSEAEIKTTMSPIDFIKTLNNEYLSVNPMRNSLSPDIARMIQ